MMLDMLLRGLRRLSVQMANESRSLCGGALIIECGKVCLSAATLKNTKSAIQLTKAVVFQKSGTLSVISGRGWKNKTSKASTLTRICYLKEIRFIALRLVFS